MIHKYFSFTLCALLLATSIAFVQAQTNTCRLTYSFKDKKSGSLSSTNLLGEFSFEAKDEDAVKLFKEENREIKILVGAQIYEDSTKTSGSKRIAVGIAFAESESTGLFQYADSAIAETIYDKKGRWISVSKIIEKNDRIYRFRFGCSRDK